MCRLYPQSSKKQCVHDTALEVLPLLLAVLSACGSPSGEIRSETARPRVTAAESTAIAESEATPESSTTAEQETRVGSQPEVVADTQPEEETAAAERLRRLREAFERQELVDAERVGFFEHYLADESADTQSNLELHLCGPRAGEFMRALVFEDLLADFSFDGCALRGDTLQCWVNGHEQRSTFVSILQGTEEAPRFRLVASYTEGLLVGPEAEEGQERDVAAFLDRVRRGETVQHGTPFLARRPLRRGVRRCQ